MLPDCDTLETAYSKAYVASRCGRPTIQLVANAEGRRFHKRFIRVWRHIRGINGWVIKRLVDKDDVVERLVVQVDVVDVLAAHTDETLKRLSTPQRLRPHKRMISISR